MRVVRVRKVVTATLEPDANGPYGPAYVVTSGAYRAVLPACPCESDGDRILCPLDYGHSKAARGRADGCIGQATGGRGGPLFCHGWHIEKALRFAAQVGATYRPKRGVVG